jgi:D-tyrosyl-tRNA(Tyr) deacylase
MISFIQRVYSARVEVDHHILGQIETGLLVLVCAERGDNQAIASKLLDKILKLRIFSDEHGKMNLSVQDVNGGLLIVSQFTLAADCSGGNRPSFGQAAPPDLGKSLYDYFLATAQQRHPVVQSGQFGANMQVHLVNDGPVSIPLTIQS